MGRRVLRGGGRWWGEGKKGKGRRREGGEGSRSSAKDPGMPRPQLWPLAPVRGIWSWTYSSHRRGRSYSDITGNKQSSGVPNPRAELLGIHSEPLLSLKECGQITAPWNQNHSSGIEITETNWNQLKQPGRCLTWTQRETKGNMSLAMKYMTAPACLLQHLLPHNTHWADTWKRKGLWA